LLGVRDELEKTYDSVASMLVGFNDWKEVEAPLVASGNLGQLFVGNNRYGAPDVAWRSEKPVICLEGPP